jgi:hypothetical protein
MIYKKDILPFLKIILGGPEYKKYKKLDLFLNNINIKDIINELLKRNNKILLKSPTNYNEDNFLYTKKYQ